MTAADRRPWSPVEVEDEIRVLLDKLDDAVVEARRLAVAAAVTKRDFKREEAKAALTIRGRNAEERKARIYLTQIVPGGKTVGDLEYESDLADKEHSSSSQHIRVLTARGDLLRSLLVSSRAVT